MDIYRKYITYDVENFINLHNLSFLDASKSTKDTFSQSLKRIEKIYNKPLPELNVVFLRNATEFMKKLEESQYSANTVLTTYTQVLKILKMVDAPLHIYCQYVKLLKEKTSERDELDKLKIDISKDSLIPYSELQNKLLSVADKYSETDDFIELRNYLLLMIFVLQIPVRVSNFTKIKIAKKLEETTDLNYNYLFISQKTNTMMFIFNKYRTVKNIGTKQLIINDDRLKEFINHYIELFEINHFLFPKDIETNKNKSMIAKEINSSILLSTYKIYGKALTVEQIRASYMMNIASIDPDFETKIEIASIMGFSNTLKLEQYE